MKTATIDGATFLKADKVLGSIDVGKNADLLIVSGKPDQKRVGWAALIKFETHDMGFDASGTDESMLIMHLPIWSERRHRADATGRSLPASGLDLLYAISGHPCR